MDVFAHGMWAYAIFHKKKYVWTSALFGVLPDVISFSIFFIASLFAGNVYRSPPPLNKIPKWTIESYNYTHSLVIFALAFLLIYLITNIKLQIQRNKVEQSMVYAD